VPRYRLNVRSWLLRVFAWDGVLPLVILGLPHAVHLCFPRAHGAIEILSIVLPISAFFIRLVVGFRHIRENRCPAFVKQLQYAALFLGILGLVIFDAFMILQLTMPQGAFQPGDWLILFGILFVFYLPCMVLAMYPGRELVIVAAQVGNWEVEA
jgi:hypothetical protein